MIIEQDFRDPLEWRDEIPEEEGEYKQMVEFLNSILDKIFTGNMGFKEMRTNLGEPMTYFIQAYPSLSRRSLYEAYIELLENPDSMYQNSSKISPHLERLLGERGSKKNLERLVSKLHPSKSYSLRWYENGILTGLSKLLRRLKYYDLQFKKGML